MDIQAKLNADLNKTLEVLKSQGKKPEDLKTIVNEYRKLDRDIRPSQVGKIQKDKRINVGTANETLVTSVRLPIPFQKKIVTNSVAFEVGEPVTLIPQSDNKKNKLADLVKELWKINRMDSKLQKLIALKKSETQAALLFYIQDAGERSVFKNVMAMLGIKEQKKEIKTTILESTKGEMYPYFDAFGNLEAFTWAFRTKTEDGKDIDNYWIYDKNNTYVIDNSTGTTILMGTKLHGFDRIPVVYVAQDEVEWKDAEALIDRFETAMSKLGGSNDYSGHPMLKIFGEVENAPDKDEDGKAWLIPKKVNEDGKEIMGDVEFLTNPNSPESNKLELDKLEDLIYAITSTPNLSFSSVKGLGNISGIALKLMFLDSLIKSKMNEGENRTAVERCLNVLISGIVNTTNTSLKSESTLLYFDVQFNSILPDDLKEAVETVSRAFESGVMSRKTAVEFLSMNSDTDEELTQITNDAANEVPV